MICKLTPALISSLLVLSGSCFATSQSTNAVRFEGSVVEPSCVFRTTPHASFQFNDCMLSGQASVIDASSVKTVSVISSTTEHRGIHVRSLADAERGGRSEGQAYVLVDGAGKPVVSGLYLITLSMP